MASDPSQESESATESELADAFGALSSDIRVQILRELWDRQQEPEYDPVSFSTLRRATGVRDSGRFNYHLDTLVPAFVRETADRDADGHKDGAGEGEKNDTGYRLTYAGQQVVGAATSGSYTDADATSLDETPLGPCPNRDCSGMSTVSYESGWVDVSCDTCDTIGIRGSAPPVVAAAATEDPSVLGEFIIAQIQKLARGFCVLCDGRLELSVTEPRSDRELIHENTGDESDTSKVEVLTECQECGNVGYVTAMTTVSDHPAVVAFLHEQGVDYREVWHEPWAASAEERLVSESPVRIEVRIPTDEETLILKLDGDLSVRDHYRA